MINLQKTTRLFAILALVLILAGCTTPTVVVPPTADIPKVRTEAAQTVVAKITIEAALNPTNTAPATEAPAAATSTTAPSPTAGSAEATATLIPTLTLAPTLKPVTGGGVVYPTATRRAGPDQAQLVTQSPGDGRIYHPSEQFDGTFTFKNVGTSTWNTNYRYKAITDKGTVMSPSTTFYLKNEVKPGDSIQLIFDMTAPSTAGRYVEYFALLNDNNAIFYGFYLVVTVQ